MCGEPGTSLLNAKATWLKGEPQTYDMYWRIIRINEDGSIRMIYNGTSVDEDLFTISGSTKGNNALSNPIGLITADEVAYAGGVSTVGNDSYYLRNGFSFRTISPAGFYSTNAYAWSVNTDGKMYSGSVGSLHVRPVINLKPAVELSTELPSGCTKLDGTANCPYMIKIN